MSLVYLHLGSNIGDRILFLQRASLYIEKKVGIVLDKSKIYETSPWGNTQQTDYLNQVVFAQTMLSAQELLETILHIEQIMGRVRSIKWGSRKIDIDILFFNRDVISRKHLKVPHPLLHKRLFVLKPLDEIAPNFIHPIYNKKISEILASCLDSEKVEEYAV